MKHLSDHDIQQYTFDRLECNPKVREHITSCNICNMRVETYLSLSTSIKSQEDPIVEFNLSNQVLKQLKSTKEKTSIYSYVIYGLIILSIGVSVSSLYSFKETIIDLFRSIPAISLAFIISITILMSLVMIFDIQRAYTKQINRLNY